MNTRRNIARRPTENKGGPYFKGCIDAIFIVDFHGDDGRLRLKQASTQDAYPEKKWHHMRQRKRTSLL